MRGGRRVLTGDSLAHLVDRGVGQRFQRFSVRQLSKFNTIDTRIFTGGSKIGEVVGAAAVVTSRV